LKPKVHDQGKIVAEYVGTDDTSPQWLVMFPSGRVKHFHNKPDIEKAAKKYFARNVKKGHIGMGRIEWHT
jgi:hypothetical protein